MEQIETENQKSTGLDYFRRMKPYDISESTDKSGWDVIDITTKEMIGRLPKPGLDDGPIPIDVGLSAAPSAEVIKYNNNIGHAGEYSRFEAADKLWKLTYPNKSLWWWRLRRLVLGYDWLVHFFGNYNLYLTNTA